MKLVADEAASCRFATRPPDGTAGPPINLSREKPGHVSFWFEVTCALDRSRGKFERIAAAIACRVSRAREDRAAQVRKLTGIYFEKQGR